MLHRDDSNREERMASNNGRDWWVRTMVLVCMVQTCASESDHNEISSGIEAIQGAQQAPSEVPNFFAADPDKGCDAVKEDGFSWTNAVGVSYDDGREFAPYFWCHVMGSEDAWGSVGTEVQVWQQSQYDCRRCRVFCCCA